MNQKNEEVVSHLIWPKRNSKFMIKDWDIHWKLEVVTEVDKRNLIAITFYIGRHKLRNCRFCWGDIKLLLSWYLRSANQLNAFVWLKRFLGVKKDVLINSLAISYFNYRPLVWMLANVKSVHKIEAIQKRALRLLLTF